jgi:hypothetical protein
MRISICVPGPDVRGELRAAAKRAWDDFNGTLRNPIGQWPASFDTIDELFNGKAFSMPVYGPPESGGAGDRIELLLSAELLTGADDGERRLTLLHECIHMQFAFGEHRARWERIQSRGKASEKVLRGLIYTESADRLNYMGRRNRAAFQLIQLPDEIVAEQRLKREYPELFAERTAYYVRMRREHFAKVSAEQHGDSFWPLQIFYELLRTSFFVPLVAGMPPFDADLRGIEAAAGGLLRQPSDLMKKLLDLRPDLLAVSMDQSVDAYEDAYNRAFELVQSLEPQIPARNRRLAEGILGDSRS